MITGKQLADAAVAAIPMGITYQQEMCDAFVRNSFKRAGGDMGNNAGANDMLRTECTKVIPLGAEPLEKGCLLFIVTPGYNDKYKDNLGDATHVGIFTDDPKAEVVHSSESRGGVFPSTLKNAWTHAGWPKDAVFSGAPEPTQPDQFGVIDLPSDQNVFFRIKPDKNSYWWARLNGGQIVEIVSESNGWTRVKAVGHDGYVESKFVKMLPGQLPPDETAPAEPPGTDTVTITLPHSAAQALFDALNESMRG